MQKYEDFIEDQSTVLYSLKQMGCPFTNIEEVRHNPLGNAKSGSVRMQSVYKRNQIYDEFICSFDMKDALKKLDALQISHSDSEQNRKQLLFLEDAYKWARQRLSAHRDLLVHLGYDGFLGEVPDAGARVQASADTLSGSVARLARAVASSAAVRTKTTQEHEVHSVAASSYLGTSGSSSLQRRDSVDTTVTPWMRDDMLLRSVASSAGMETKTTSDDVEDGSSYGTMVLPSRSVRIPKLLPRQRPAMVVPWRPGNNSKSTPPPWQRPLSDRPPWERPALVLPSRSRKRGRSLPVTRI